MNKSFDDSSFITLRAPIDLLSRPLYQSTINLGDSKLSEVLTQYHFDEPYACGLSTCRTPHQEGFLVLTDDGVETNIGGICGRRIFGDDFAIKANLQAQRARLKYQTETLQEVRNNKTSLISRIADLLDRPYGIKWSEHTLKDFKEAIGHTVFSKLRDKARRNDPVVERTRAATQDERDRYQVANFGGKPLQFITEKVGDISGLDFLNHDCLRALIELKDKLHALDYLDVKALPSKTRKDWVDWAGGIERTFSICEGANASALRFFTQENFKLLPALSDDKKIKEHLSNVRWSRSEMQVTAKKSK